MAETTLILALLADGTGLVPYRGGVTELPDFRKAVYNVRVYVVVPDPNSSPLNGGYLPIDLTAFDGLRMGAWSTSPGTDASLLALTQGTDWTLTTDSGGIACFQGIFQTLTDEMIAFIAASARKSFWLAVNLYKGLNLYPILDWATTAEAATGNAVIDNVTDPGTSYSIIATQATPILPGTTTINFGGSIFALTLDPDNPNSLLLTKVI